MGNAKAGLMVLLLLSGCVHHVYLTPQVPTSIKVLPLRAKYFLGPNERSWLHEGRYLPLGTGRIFLTHVGEALEVTFPAALRDVFVGVTPAAGPDDAADVDALVIPSITSYFVNPASIAATFQVRVKMVGPHQEVLMDEIFEALPRDGTAGAVSWFYGGNYGVGEWAVTQAGNLAFEDLFQRMIPRMRQVMEDAQAARRPPPAPSPTP